MWLIGRTHLLLLSLKDATLLPPALPGPKAPYRQRADFVVGASGSRARSGHLARMRYAHKLAGSWKRPRFKPWLLRPLVGGPRRPGFSQGRCWS